MLKYLSTNWKYSIVLTLIQPIPYLFFISLKHLDTMCSKTHLFPKTFADVNLSSRTSFCTNWKWYLILKRKIRRLLNNTLSHRKDGTLVIFSPVYFTAWLMKVAMMPNCFLTGRKFINKVFFFPFSKMDPFKSPTL